MIHRWAIVYFLAFLLAVTWPGYLFFNRVEPLVFGLPFNMAWILGWVVGGGVVLFLADRADRGREEE